MLTKQMNDELFEVILENAFSESFNRDLKRYEASATTLLDAEPTKEHRKRAQEAYKRKTRTPLNGVTILQKIAVAILVVFSIWNALMLCSPSVQAAVKDTIANFLNKYISFNFSNDDNFITVGTHRLGYVPNGYRLIDSITAEGYERYTFSNGTDEINLRIMSSSISEVGIDREKRIMQPVKIKDYVAYALLYDDSNASTIVIWGDDNRSFSLIGKLSLAELTKIANSFE